MSVLESPVLAAALLGGSYVAATAMNKPTEVEDKTAELETTINSLRSTITSLSASLDASATELSTLQAAHTALKVLYENSKAEGGLTEELVVGYEATISKLSERMQFLSNYLSAELGRSVESVSSHDIPKMPGLYIDPATAFSDAAKDPTFYYGPNGDIRMHNVPVLDMFPSLYYQDSASVWTSGAVSSAASASGSIRFKLLAGKRAKLASSNPAALDRAAVGMKYARVGPPTSYDGDAEDKKFYDCWTLIEFDESFDMEAFFNVMGLKPYERYIDASGAAQTSFRDVDSVWGCISITAIPVRSNVLLFKACGSSNIAYAGTAPLDFGFYANSDIDVHIRSVNNVYLPWYCSNLGHTETKIAGKSIHTPGTSFKTFNDQMKVI